VKYIHSVRMIVDCLTTEIFFCYESHFSFHTAGVHKELTTPQLPSHYVQPSSRVIVRSVTTLLPLHFKYQTRVQNDHHKCLESDGHDIFKGISQRICEVFLANHEEQVSIFGYRADIRLGCLLYADLSHASWLNSACMTFHFRSKSCRPLSFCPHV
jgi:hypothetical protein